MRHFRHLLMLGAVTSCSPALVRGISQDVAALNGQAPQPAGVPGQAIYIFGGTNHRVFLGCLSCSSTAANAITNQYGEFGSRFGETVLNRFSDYGSKYSDLSACNPYANDPPVVVGADGTYYGRLSMNPRFTTGPHVHIAAAWITSVCAAA